MKKLYLVIFIILFCFTSPSAWSGDFDKGSTAFKSGDYATALREWKPLA